MPGEKSTDPDITATAAGEMMPRMGAGSNTNLVAGVKYAGAFVSTTGCAGPTAASASWSTSRVPRCKSASVSVQFRLVPSISFRRSCTRPEPKLATLWTNGGGAKNCTWNEMKVEREGEEILE